MKKYILLFGFTASLFFGTMNAQQLPMFSQYMNNYFVLNPALAGAEADFSPLRLFVRSQWMGIEGAPKTQMLSYHTSFAEGKMGIGAYFFNDRFGTVSRTGLNATYAYHVQLSDDSKLSFGLAAMFYRYHLATDSLRWDIMNNVDPIIYQGSGDFKTFTPNANFGINYANKNIWVGIGVSDLIPVKIAASDSFYVVKELPHIYATLGGKFAIAEDIFLEPSMLIKRVSGAPIQMDLNVNLKLKGKFNFGVTFRPGDAVSIMAGFRIKEQYTIGYAYDFIISELNTYTKGNHEIMLGFNFMKAKKEETTGDAPMEQPKEEKPEEKKDDSKEQK